MEVRKSTLRQDQIEAERKKKNDEIIRSLRNGKLSDLPGARKGSSSGFKKVEKDEEAIRFIFGKGPKS